LYAERWSDSGSFVVSKSPSYAFSEDYIGLVTNNFWGHEFTVFDHGVDEKIHKKFPSGFVKVREVKMQIKFETNILGESPRSLSVEAWNEETKEMTKFKNLPPKWNERTECYTLNFYGRVSRASAKNFQLIMPEDTETVYLMFGKIGTESFHLDYRSPLSMYQAFCIALAGLARKRVVA
jgi:tubby and related proteins